jgi:Enoyl-(Acyl carrier protein) reductase/Helix-turn-helix domain
VARLGRPGMSDEMKADLWRRWRAGESISVISRQIGKPPGSVFTVLKHHGGIAPVPRKARAGSLTTGEREEIARGLCAGESYRTIAGLLGRAASTISREVNKNGGRDVYRAVAAQERARERARRPKPCLLASSPALRQKVLTLLRQEWSPEQKQPLELLTLGAGQLAGPAFALARLRPAVQPRRDSELMPSSRATAVTVLPEESTSAIAFRLNSSVYRFVYLLPTWCYFLWNLKIPVSRCPRSRGSFIATFTQGLAQMLASDGIRVNAVAPGPVWTALIPATMPDTSEFGKHTPLGRPAQPAEIAPSYVFLASEHASFLTAEIVNATGGAPLR